MQINLPSVLAAFVGSPINRGGVVGELALLVRTRHAVSLLYAALRLRTNIITIYINASKNNGAISPIGTY